MLFFISFVSAFSVSAPYTENKEFEIPLEQKTKTLQFVLQNGGATSAVNAKASIIKGAEIISITDSSNIYSIVPGSKVPVNFIIEVPEDAQVGDKYPIELDFTVVTDTQSGAFGFGTGIIQRFNITIGEETPIPPEEEEEKTSKSLIYILIGLILVIIFFIIRKRQNKK